MKTTPVAVSATAGAAALAPSGLGGCLASLGSRLSLSFLASTASSDTEPTAGGAGNGGLDGFAPAHKGDPEEQDLYDFLCGSLGRTAARQERRRRTEVRVSGDGRSSPGSPWEAARPPGGYRPGPRTPDPERGRVSRRAGRLRGCGFGAARVSVLWLGGGWRHFKEGRSYMFVFLKSIYAYIIFLKHTAPLNFRILRTLKNQIEVSKLHLLSFCYFLTSYPRYRKFFNN